MTTTQDLLALAQEVLDAATLPPDQFLDRVAAYSDAFQKWNVDNQQALMGTATGAEAESLRSLAKLHAKIIDLAEALKDKTSHDLKHLKRKGKGIMAYTDILPKRISIWTRRKG